jgi:hypothetical protein
MTKNRDLLGALALLAALIATASAEYQLARAVGFGEFTAGCVPAALDVYALRAFSVKRDVSAVVGALILTNALAHLVDSGMLTVSVPLVIAVSAIAPLVLWRVKALSASLTPDQPVSATPEPVKPERAAECPTEAPRKAPEPKSETKPDPLIATARTFAADVHSATGKAPSLRALQSHLSIGQARAQRIRGQLAGGAA